MGSKHYRRGEGAGATVAAPDPTDPYAAYLSWVAEGRPSLNSGLSTGPTPMPAGPGATAGAAGAIATALEPPAVRVTAHVQVQQDLDGPPELPMRASLWQRLTTLLRGR